MRGPLREGLRRGALVQVPTPGAWASSRWDASRRRRPGRGSEGQRLPGTGEGTAPIVDPCPRCARHLCLRTREEPVANRRQGRRFSGESMWVAKNAQAIGGSRGRLTAYVVAGQGRMGCSVIRLHLRRPASEVCIGTLPIVGCEANAPAGAGRARPLPDSASPRARLIGSALFPGGSRVRRPLTGRLRFTVHTGVGNRRARSLARRAPSWTRHLAPASSSHLAVHSVAFPCATPSAAPSARGARGTCASLVLSHTYTMMYPACRRSILLSSAAGGARAEAEPIHHRAVAC